MEICEGRKLSHYTLSLASGTLEIEYATQIPQQSSIAMKIIIHTPMISTSLMKCDFFVKSFTRHNTPNCLSVQTGERLGAANHICATVVAKDFKNERAHLISMPMQGEPFQ